MSEGYIRTNTNKILFSGILTILGVFVFFSNDAFAAAGINKQINFQGKVVNADGTNVTNGNYDFVFKLYSVDTAGTAIWTETRTGGNQVTVTDGVFQVNLGSVTTLPGSIDFNTDNIYLGVTFHTDSEMTPRVRFTAVPYAFNADKIHGLTVTDTTGTLTIANGKTVSFADAFTTSGAFPITMTASGSTSVALPTSGTLAGLENANAWTGAQTFSSATSTNDTLGFSIANTGAGRFAGTFTNADLTANHAWTLPNVDGTVITTGNLSSITSTGTLSSLTVSGAIAANGGVTFDNTSDTIGSHTAGGTVFMNSNIFQDIGNTGTDFIASTGALTLAGVLTANGGISLAGGQSMTAGALSYVDLGLIVHNTTANQGFRLPQAASATPSNPTSGEGYLAWDAAGNQLITYNGSAWTTVGGGSQTPWASDISAAGYDLGNLSNLGFQETTGAPTGTDVGFYRDNSGDLTGNVLTGKTLNVAVNGTDEYNFSSSALAMNSNNITGLGTNLTSAAGLTIASTTNGLTLDSGSGVTTIATGDYLALSHSGVAGAAAGYLWYDSSDNKYKINENGTTKTLCNTTDLGCGAGGSSDLQTTYGNDADGGNATISLTAADDGLVFTNPTSGGNNLSAFLLQLDQANTTAAVVALDIVQSSNAANAANITANAIDTETALAITADGLTSGKGLTVNSSSTGLTSSGDVVAITLSGTNASNAGDVLMVANTGAANTNTSLHVDHQATGTNNLAVRVDDVSGDTTPFVIDGAGNVGIGTAAPNRILDIVQAASAPQLRLSKDLTYYSEFTVDSVGDLQVAAVGGDIRALSENVWVCDNDACPALTLTGEGNIFVENVLKFGNGVYIKNDSATELSVYDNDDQAMLIFDEL